MHEIISINDHHPHKSGLYETNFTGELLYYDSETKEFTSPRGTKCSVHWWILVEEWKDVIGWELNYSISNLGRIRCKNYLHHKGKIYISNGVLNNNGYLKYELKYNDNKEVFSIHRLVAIHFIENKDNKKCVNHKNGIRSDNRLVNLEWVTYFENYKHASNVLGSVQKVIPILQFDLEGNYINTFRSISDIQSKLGFNKSNIHKHLKGHKYYKTAYGYIWKYYTHVSNNLLQQIQLPI